MGWSVPVNSSSSSSNGEKLEPLPICEPGDYKAVLVGIIDLGTQRKKEYEGYGMRDRHMVALMWELQGVETEAGEPFYFAEEYTLSLAVGPPAAKLRGILARGGIKVPDNTEEFDIETALGAPYMIEIVVETSTRGNEYSRIAKDGVSKASPTDRQAIKKPKRKPFAWKISQGPIPARDWLARLYGRTIWSVQEKAKELQGRSGEAQEDRRPAPRTQQRRAVRPDEEEVRVERDGEDPGPGARPPRDEDIPF